MQQKQRPRRVLIVGTGWTIGGSERLAVNLGRELRAHGWKVKTVFPAITALEEPAEALRAQRSDKFRQWLHEQDAEAEVTSDVQCLWMPHTWRGVFALRRLVRRFRPDVVNIHFGDNYILAKDILAIRLAGVRRCVVSVNHPTPWNPGTERRRQVTGLAARLADAVVVISRATGQVLREAGIPAHKVHLVPCGVPPPQDLPTQAEARSRLGLPPSAFVIGSLSQLVPHKGIGEFLAAAAQVPDPDGTLCVAVAGDGPERAALEALADERLPGRCVFLGHVPSANDFYAACDVFVLPSHMEGFGLVYVEAAFHGVPSIGTNVGGVPDAIADGETGLLVPVGDVNVLTVAIQRLRDDPALRKRWGDAARRRAQTEFTAAVMAERYEPILYPHNLERH